MKRLVLTATALLFAFAATPMALADEFDDAVKMFSANDGRTAAEKLPALKAFVEAHQNDQRVMPALLLLGRLAGEANDNDSMAWGAKIYGKLNAAQAEFDNAVKTFSANDGRTAAEKLPALKAFVEAHQNDQRVMPALLLLGRLAGEANDNDSMAWGAKIYGKLCSGTDKAAADATKSASSPAAVAATVATAAPKPASSPAVATAAAPVAASPAPVAAATTDKLPPVRLYTVEDADAAMKKSGNTMMRKRQKRSFPLVGPVAEDGFFDNLTSRSAVAHVRELIREIVGPLEGEDARLFEAKWNAVMDFPATNIVEWLKKAAPIASEIVRIKNFINENTSELVAVYDEANIARTFGSFEAAEQMMGDVEDMAASLMAAKDRMAELLAKLEALGEMPDPVEEKKTAAERRRTAEKTVKDVFGSVVNTKIGGWYKAVGKMLSGKPVTVGKNGKPVGEEPRWKIEAPAWERIYIRPLFKYADTGIVVVYVNRYEGTSPDMNLVRALEGKDGSLTIFDAGRRTTLSLYKDASGNEFLSMKTLEKVLGLNATTTLFTHEGGEDLKMLPGSKDDNVVDIAVFDSKNPEKAKSKEMAKAFGKIYADNLKEDMEAFQKVLDKELKGNVLGDMPYAKDVYYVLSGMAHSAADVVKELKNGSADYPDVIVTDGHYKDVISKLGNANTMRPRGNRQLIVQKAMFRCDVKMVDQIFFSCYGKRTPLDSGSAEMHVKWTPPSLVFRAPDNKFSMTFWSKIGISPPKHAKIVPRIEIACQSGQPGIKAFTKVVGAGEAKEKATCEAVGMGWADPELTVKFSLTSCMGGDNELGDQATLAVRCKYKRMVMTEDEAAQLAEDMAKKYGDAMRKEWSSQEFGEVAKQVDDYVAELKASEDATETEVENQARQKERLEFHNENIKFIDGTISRLKKELDNEKDASRRSAIAWQITCEESNKIYEQDRINAEKTGEFRASRTPFDTMCQMQVFESAMREVECDKVLRREQERLDVFLRNGSQYKLDEDQKRRVYELADKIDLSDPLKAAIEYRKISNNLLKSDVNATKGRVAMLDDEILKYEDLLVRAQRVKTGCDIALALGGIAISGGVAAGELVPAMATKFEVLKYTYAMGCGYAESGPLGILKGAVCTYEDWVDIIWSGIDGYIEGKKALKKGEDVSPWAEALKGAGWSFFMNKGLPKIMEKVNWRKQITFGKSKASAPEIKVDTPDVKAYKAEVDKARGDISAYVQAKNKINTMSEVDLASGKITDAQIQKLRMDVVKAAAKINANPTAKAILKYEQGYAKIGKDFNLELDRVHSAVKSEYYKDMKAKGFSDETINMIRNASSGKSVGMDADWGLDETKGMKITRDGKPVSVYDYMVEGQKSWNAKYQAVTGQRADLSWENITTHAHPEAYRNMEILKANGSDAKMRDLLRRTSLADAQQIADVTRFKADDMLNKTDFPRLVYVREAARGSAKDLGNKFLPALDAKINPLARLERMAGKHGKGLTQAQAHELNRLRAAREYYGRVHKVFDEIGKGKIPPEQWDMKIDEITGGIGISDTLGNLGDLFKSLVF